jgi:hypothetical protein
MRRLICVLVMVLAASTPAPARDGGSRTLTWSDTARDVYIDGELDRTAQVLICDEPSRLVIISPRLDRAVVLNISDHTVNKTGKDAFHFAADHASATSDESISLENAGKYARLNGPIYFFALDGKPLLIRSQSGAEGPLTREKLWETVPVWRTLSEDYKPDAEAVAALRACGSDTRVTLLFGTWCPDSKKHITRLLKALDNAANPHLQVSMIAINHDFDEPADTIQSRELTNVPTVIVERDGREIGRIVETPATATIEDDLAAILTGKPLIHTGRWDRGRLLARGSYQYRDGKGNELGREQWELWDTAEGGRFLRSAITSGEISRLVYHRTNAAQQTTFVEITTHHGGDVSRTRYNIDGRSFTARVRGNASGVILQTLEVPESLDFSSPAIASAALGLRPGGETASKAELTGYFAPRGIEATTGSLRRETIEARGIESIRAPSGEFKAKHVVRTVGEDTSEWWLHAALGIPVRGKAAGVEYVLTALEIPSDK